MLRLAAAAFVLTAAVAISTLLMAPSTAQACMCVSEEAYVVGADGTESLVHYPAGADGADVAFVGRPVSEEEIGPWEVVVLLEVDWVYKGNVGSRIEILTETATTCALYLAPNVPTGLLAYRDDNGVLGAGACSPARIAALKHVFGAGYPPDPSVDVPAGSVAGDSEDSGPSLALVLLVAVVLPVAISLGAVWVIVSHRRRGRTAPAAESPEEGS